MSEGRLYIGRLSHHARERDIDDLFGRYGRVRSIELKSGFGYVEFSRQREADDAQDSLDGRDFMGERLIVERAKPRFSAPMRSNYGGSRDRGDRGDRDRDSYGAPRGRDRDMGQPSWVSKYGAPERTHYRVLVTNLPSRVKWQDLKDFFRKSGCEVTFADAHRSAPGEAIVEFASRDDMNYAIRKCDDAEMGGKHIRVEE
eukprot:Ihof_evm4s389 gene=Ihof_evmTU4s389